MPEDLNERKSARRYICTLQTPSRRSSKSAVLTHKETWTNAEVERFSRSLDEDQGDAWSLCRLSLVFTLCSSRIDRGPNAYATGHYHFCGANAKLRQRRGYGPSCRLHAQRCCAKQPLRSSRLTRSCDACAKRWQGWLPQIALQRPRRRLQMLRYEGEMAHSPAHASNASARLPMSSL